MHRGLGAASVLLSMSLAACGGSSTTAAKKTTPAATPVVNPCSAVTRKEASVALGARAAAGRLSGADCLYAAGGKTIRVTATPATAQARAVLKSPIKSSGVGKVGVSKPGLSAIVTIYSKASPAQAGIYFIKGQHTIQIVLTAPRMKSGSLTSMLAALARAVARAT